MSALDAFTAAAADVLEARGRLHRAAEAIRAHDERGARTIRALVRDLDELRAYLQRKSHPRMTTTDRQGRQH